MIVREATIEDIPAIQVIRNSVKENMLSDPSLVTDEDCSVFISKRGKGWVAVLDNRIIGFAIADLQEDNIWALFVHPEFEGKGAGTALQEIMLDWYFSQEKEKLWLGTAPGTRAEKFYRSKGWKHTGLHGTKEIKFEMSADEWEALRSVNLNGHSTHNQ